MLHSGSHSLDVISIDQACKVKYPGVLESHKESELLITRCGYTILGTRAGLYTLHQHH